MSRKVIIRGYVFGYEEKAPFVRSGHSVLGAIEYDGDEDLLKCHECGGWFAGIGGHLKASIHRITAKEYKARHGLRGKTSLLSMKVRAIRKAQSAGNAERLLRAIRTNGRKPPVLSERPHRESFHELRNVRGKCNAQMIFRIQTLAGTIGRTPSGQEITDSGIGVTSILDAFGVKNLNDAITLMGLTPNPHTPQYSQETLLNILREFKKANGRWPMATECSGPSLPSRSTFIRAFGSLKLACEEAVTGRMPWPKDYFDVSIVPLQQRSA